MASTAHKMPELLAPVGEFASLPAAAAAGADAVYFGLEGLSMRAKTSTKFQVHDMLQIKDLCVQSGMKAYLTLNTVLYDHELEQVDLILGAAAEAGIDAVIVSDGAALRRCQQLGLSAHISTQLSISNLDALEFYAPWADRVVLARELDLDKVAAIVRGISERGIRGPSGRLVEIELFAHGAMCVAVSGRCQMSLYQYNKAGNRGECWQSCRRSWRVTDTETGEELIIDNNYVMSPEDLCTLPFLDKLVGAGVSVLKIEGRNRSPEYVLETVGAYRRALEAIEAGTYTEELKNSLVQQVAQVYNRGFSSGFYLGYKPDQWSASYGSKATHRKVYSAKVTKFWSKASVAEVLVEAAALEMDAFEAGDELLVIGPTTGVLRFCPAELRVDEEVCRRADKGQLATFVVPERVRVNDRVYIFRRVTE